MRNCRFTVTRPLTKRASLHVHVLKSEPRQTLGISTHVAPKSPSSALCGARRARFAWHLASLTRGAAPPARPRASTGLLPRPLPRGARGALQGGRMTTSATTFFFLSQQKHRWRKKKQKKPSPSERVCTAVRYLFSRSCPWSLTRFLRSRLPARPPLTCGDPCLCCGLRKQVTQITRRSCQAGSSRSSCSGLRLIETQIQQTQIPWPRDKRPACLHCQRGQ